VLKNAPKSDPTNETNVFSTKQAFLPHYSSLKSLVPPASFKSGWMQNRRDFYDARAPFRAGESNRHYHRLIEHYYRFHIPAGARVLEAGSGLGDLLAAVRPAEGVGLDFSPEMTSRARQRHSHLRFDTVPVEEYASESRFDYIIASDLVNDLDDVQAALKALRGVAHGRTRLILNFFNYFWRPVLATAAGLGQKAPTLTQNWLSTHDMENLLRLAGWELIRAERRILCPVDVPLLGSFLNRGVAPLGPHQNLTTFMVARPLPNFATGRELSCSIVIPARNEAGNIEAAVQRMPRFGASQELIFVEGNSTDATWDEIERVRREHPEWRIKTLRQVGKGKGSAVRQGFGIAEGELLFILDADLTMPPEQLPKFYEVARTGVGEFINGVRLVYPMENEAMPFLNLLANHFFGRAFSWLIGQPVKDTLCGTKVLLREDYEEIARNRAYFGDFDPFGDFDLLFGAAKLNLKIVDLPIRYAARTYGQTNISRWRDGALLLRMVAFAAKRLKFV